MQPGDNAWIEEPGYWGIKNILRINAVNFSAIPVDEQGMVPLEAGESAPKLIFVTPSHQYPLGSVMSLNRRRALLFRARETRSWIVEDDYDSEFRFSGQPIPSLQGLEERRRSSISGHSVKHSIPHCGSVMWYCPNRSPRR